MYNPFVTAVEMFITVLYSSSLFISEFFHSLCKYLKYCEYYIILNRVSCDEDDV